MKEKTISRVATKLENDESSKISAERAREQKKFLGKQRRRQRTESFRSLETHNLEVESRAKKLYEFGGLLATEYRGHKSPWIVVPQPAKSDHHIIAMDIAEGTGEVKRRKEDRFEGARKVRFDGLVVRLGLLAAEDFDPMSNTPELQVRDVAAIWASPSRTTSPSAIMEVARYYSSSRRVEPINMARRTFAHFRNEAVIQKFEQSLEVIESAALNPELNPVIAPRFNELLQRTA